MPRWVSRATVAHRAGNPDPHYLTRLHFGVQARKRERRRRRRKRVVLAAWIMSTVAMLAGIPGSGATSWLRYLPANRAEAHDRAVQTSESIAATMRFQRHVLRPPRQPTLSPSPAAPSTTRTASVTSTTPAPVPSSTPAITLVGTIPRSVYAAAAEFGVSGDYMLAIAVCESDLDPYAQNEAGYYGLFQFDHPTWAAYGYGAIYDVVAQARTAARLVAAGETHRWPNCA
jgi:soluble lytic murein transglycosylase-like protein